MMSWICLRALCARNSHPYTQSTANSGRIDMVAVIGRWMGLNSWTHWLSLWTITTRMYCTRNLNTMIWRGGSRASEGRNTERTKKTRGAPGLGHIIPSKKNCKQSEYREVIIGKLWKYGMYSAYYLLTETDLENQYCSVRDYKGLIFFQKVQPGGFC